ncbi:TetR/AcrR family transcriptional regulator [Variovorax sp. LG9.2]|uniref:TetR/AcrR family transcriptional regulator n=1 Tax=Variovorax sp. LG9.2 TaxID=3048626 RepID=UPI002B22D320|nr:TetR/AcrR family transcriptional regulator [Variovorax sp. LG9.2]MEB0056179.1 TetR/AcrR family transcriptional regulator [Variovorax sp. LG9.2]
MPNFETEPTQAPRAGLRERSKTDKRKRIIEAARAVFIEHGYEAATTREIATRADVSTGTVFVYAKDKRDLLLQVVNDELDAVNLKGQALLERPGSLRERLLPYFELRYRYWASEPRLARPALRETSEFLAPGATHGEEAHRFYARRPVILGHIEQMVRAAQKSGEAQDDVPADQIASLIFSLYLIEVRRWLNDEPPRLASGMKRLSAVLGLFVRGILSPGHEWCRLSEPPSSRQAL